MNDTEIEDRFSREGDPRGVLEKHGFEALGRGFATSALSRPRLVMLLMAAALAVGFLALMVAMDQVEAAFPGDNGRIAFTNDEVTPGNPQGDQEIYTMNPDGTDIKQLTSNAAADLHPAWTADGRQIAFDSDREGQGDIYRMDADGSNQTRLTDDLAPESSPAWSPDGTQIVFDGVRDYDSHGFDENDIYIMNADGSDVRNLTYDPAVVSADVDPTWSADGTQIAFTSRRDGNFEIYQMNADGTNQTNLTNDGGSDHSPTWSPDGQWIAFGSDRDGNGDIYQMNADGSNQTNLTEDPSADVDPAWSPDGTQIAFSSDRDVKHEIYKMNVDGTNQTNLTNTTAGDESNPDWGVPTAPDTTNPTITIITPPEGATYILNEDVKADYKCEDEAGGSGIKSCAGPVANGAAIDTSSLGTKSFTVNAEDNAGNKGTLTHSYEVVKPPDVTKPTITITTPAEGARYVLKRDVKADYKCEDEAGGSGIKSCAGPVANGAAIDTSSLGTKSFTVNAEDNAGNKGTLTHSYEVVASNSIPPKVFKDPFSRTIVFVSTRITPDNPEGDREIFKMDSNGISLRQLTTNDEEDGDPAWSPNHTKIAFTSHRHGAPEIYVMNADGTNQTRLTNNLAWDTEPTWSPDGKKIAFVSERTTEGIYTMNADGTNQTRLPNTFDHNSSPDWSPDGSRIAFVSGSFIPDDSDICTMKLDGTDFTNLSNRPNDNDFSPAWSPNGRLIAFGGEGPADPLRTGDYNIYTMTADGANQTKLTTINSAWNPAWSPDGRQIAFMSFHDGTQDIHRVNVDGTNLVKLTNDGSLNEDPDW